MVIITKTIIFIHLLCTLLIYWKFVPNLQCMGSNLSKVMLLIVRIQQMLTYESLNEWTNKLAMPKKNEHKLFLGLCCFECEYESFHFYLVWDCLSQLRKTRKRFKYETLEQEQEKYSTDKKVTCSGYNNKLDLETLKIQLPSGA